MSKKIVSPEAVLSYPYLDEPQEPQNGKGDPKYSCSLVFAPGTDMTAMQAAVIEAAVEKWGQAAVAKLKSGALKTPFRTDAEAKGYPEGSTFINVRSTQKPGAVYLWPDPTTGKPAVIQTDKITTELYAGAKVRASITAFAYDNESKGVSFGLNNLQKLADGPRLDGRKAAEDEFEADASIEPANLDDVL